MVVRGRDERRATCRGRQGALGMAVECLEGLLCAERRLSDKMTESYMCTHTDTPVWRVQFELSSRVVECLFLGFDIVLYLVQDPDFGRG